MNNSKGPNTSKPAWWISVLKWVSLSLASAIFGGFVNHVCEYANRGQAPLVLNEPSVVMQAPKIRPGLNEFDIPVHIPSNPKKIVYYNYYGTVDLQFNRVAGTISSPFFYFPMEDGNYEGDSKSVKSKWFKKLVVDQSPGVLNDRYKMHIPINYTGADESRTNTIYLLFRDKNRNVSIYILLLDLTANTRVDMRSGLKISTDLKKLAAPTVRGYYLATPFSLLGTSGQVRLNNGSSVTVNPDQIITTSQKLVSMFKQTY